MPTLSGRIRARFYTVGVVEKVKRTVEMPGDVILGLPSSGLHSNGFSLARKVFLEKTGLYLGENIEELDGKLGDVLLEPTRIYVSLIKKILNTCKVKGLAHITGGGLTENIPRVLPENCQGVIYKDSWPVLPVFTMLQKLGEISPEEMYRTFNMGIGMVLILEPKEAEKVKDLCSQLNRRYLRNRVCASGQNMINFKEGKSL